MATTASRELSKRRRRVAIFEACEGSTEWAAVLKDSLRIETSVNRLLKQVGFASMAILNLRRSGGRKPVTFCRLPTTGMDLESS